MTNKMVLHPGPRHPITVEPADVRVVVRVAGKVIADSSSALTLREADYPPVHYLPHEDVDMAALERTDHDSYCPFKGDAAYFSIPAAGERGINAVWTYEEPYDAVLEIKDRVAFYTNRMDAVDELPVGRNDAVDIGALAAPLLVIVGAFALLYVFIIGGQAFPLELFPGYRTASSFGDGVIQAYAPSLPELALGLSGVGIAFLIALVGVRLFDFLPHDEAPAPQDAGAD